jgi:hypothetical protein
MWKKYKNKLKIYFQNQEDKESKEKIESALDRLDKAIEELQQISTDVRNHTANNSTKR